MWKFKGVIICASLAVWEGHFF